MARNCVRTPQEAKTRDGRPDLRPREIGALKSRKRGF